MPGTTSRLCRKILRLNAAGVMQRIEEPHDACFIVEIPQNKNCPKTIL
jgi:hypothetical protein